MMVTHRGARLIGRLLGTALGDWVCARLTLAWALALRKSDGDLVLLIVRNLDDQWPAAGVERQ